MSENNNSQNINISKSKNVHVSGVSHVVSNSGGQNDLSEIERAFESILLAVTKLPEGEDKEEAKQAVEALKGEACKGEQAQEKKVHKWLVFLLETAPDVCEVAVETFLNPVKGMSMVFQKIAARVKKKLQGK
jgi:hypothetical protein